jgi:hypothetical protein
MWWVAVAVAFEPNDLRDGDLVFHRSTSAQSVAIAEATHSTYTHVGVVLRQEGRVRVLEAVEPVRMTPVDEWIAAGRGPTVAKRLKDAEVLTPEVLERMRALADGWLGMHYDALFAWTDEAMYCSELAWKLYERAAGVRLGEPRALSTYQLDGPAVSIAAKKRFPKGLPLHETVISPQDLFDDPQLVNVP